MSPSIHNKDTPASSSLVVKAANVSSSNDEKAAKDKKGVEVEQSGEDYVINIIDRSYRVRGLQKNSSFDVLKVNLRLWHNERFYLDTLDFYRAKERNAFVMAAASETNLEPDLVKRDLGRVLLALEEVQEKRIREELEPKEEEVTIAEPERAAALELLKSPDLLGQILRDFDLCGIVGEAMNKLTGYLAAVSRKLDKPLAIIVQSTSAAGKTALMESVLAMMPEEERVKYSAMTGQSLYYLGETNLNNKILAIVEDEGAEKASYALKLLQSESELTIASTGKDDHLYRYRKPNGKPLGYGTQRERIGGVRDFFGWLCRSDHIPFNPASELEMPRPEKRLPEEPLSIAQVETVLGLPDLDDPLGVRDRAMMELFYSCGLRRSELVHLTVTDLNHERQTLQIRQGKGKKDRVVPVGSRALAWLEKYLDEVRPQLLLCIREQALFLTSYGEAFNPDVLSRQTAAYIKKADLGRGGSCHLFRHTYAGRRRGYPLHPATARPCQHRDHAELHRG